MKKKIKTLEAVTCFGTKTRWFFLFLIVSFCSYSAVLAGTWSGVDETVVEKYAHEHGRQARKPYINTDQGDLLLFLFLLAGSVGGFIAGYSWKKLMDPKPVKRE